MQKRRLVRNNVTSFDQGCDDAQNSDSDLEYASSSEQSCTTVIYLGRSHPLRKLNGADRVKKLSVVENKEVVDSCFQFENEFHLFSLKTRASAKSSIFAPACLLKPLIFKFHFEFKIGVEYAIAFLHELNHSSNVVIYYFGNYES